MLSGGLGRLTGGFIVGWSARVLGGLLQGGLRGGGFRVGRVGLGPSSRIAGLGCVFLDIIKYVLENDASASLKLRSFLKNASITRLLSEYQTFSIS